MSFRRLGPYFVLTYLPVAQTYYLQLGFLEHIFPFCSEAIRVQFTWHDAFRSGPVRSLTCGPATWGWGRGLSESVLMPFFSSTGA
jgi:hypothetical protein